MSTVIEGVYKQSGQADVYLPFKCDSDGNMSVDTLAGVGIARQLAAGASSTSVALTTTCRRISITARTADVRYAVGVGAQTATTTSGQTTSHFIAMGERLDIDVVPGSTIAAIRAGSVDGSLEISELVTA